MGYFAGYANYAEWHEARGTETCCAYCKKPYTPTAAQNRHCADCLPAYWHDKWRDSLSRDGFIRKVCGMTPAEYIAEWGQEAYNSL